MAAGDVKTFLAGTATKGAGNALKGGLWGGLLAGGFTALLGIALTVAAVIALPAALPGIVAFGIGAIGVIGTGWATGVAAMGTGIFSAQIGGAWGLLTGGYKAVKEKKADEGLQAAQRATDVQFKTTEMQRTAQEMEQLAHQAETAALAQHKLPTYNVPQPQGAEQQTWGGRLGHLNREGEREKNFVQRVREQDSALATAGPSRN